MGYRLLADLLLILHLLFICFVLFGGFLCLIRIRWAWFHLPAAAWGVWIEWSGRICPLTPLENRFRVLAFDEGYQGGFIEHYLLPVIYPEKLSFQIQLILGSIVILTNLGVYLLVFLRRRNLKRQLTNDINALPYKKNDGGHIDG